MVAIDTDVLVLAFAFHRDSRQEANAQFLEAARPLKPLVTIYSVMELLGQLSFNLEPERLVQWPVWLQDAYGLTIAHPHAVGMDGEVFFRQEMVERPLARMQQHGMSFMDSLIINLVECVEGVDALVTWNARYFRGKTSLAVFTPAEFLQNSPQNEGRSGR